MRYKITKNGYGNYNLYRRVGLFSWKFHDLFKTQQEARERAIELEGEKLERKAKNSEKLVEYFTVNKNSKPHDYR